MGTPRFARTDLSCSRRPGRFTRSTPVPFHRLPSGTRRLDTPGSRARCESPGGGPETSIRAPRRMTRRGTWIGPPASAGCPTRRIHTGGLASRPLRAFTGTEGARSGPSGLFRALALSSDSHESPGQRRRDENRHSNATRQSHWTWRFTPVPWDRDSSGRKRRSGRRSSTGSPLEDHVKVAGRGAISCFVGWHASRKGFVPVQVGATDVRDRSGISIPHAERSRPPRADHGRRPPSGKWKPSNGKAQGSIGHLADGNGGWVQRTSQRTKALRSSDPG